MPQQSRDPRTDPRAKLGEKLRKGRIAAGFASQDSLAAKIPCDRSTVGHAESGSRPPKPDSDLLAQWAELCSLDLAELREWAEVAQAYDGPVPVWFEKWLEYESGARTLHYWAIVVVPGIFQTPTYARALLVAMGYDADKVEDLVTARMERKAVLDRADPPNVVAVLDENVLHRLIGSVEIMREQLTYLADMAERPNISIQIVPASGGANAGLGGALNVADGMVCHMDAITEGRTSDEPEAVSRATVLFDRIRADALPRKTSRDQIRRLADELWSTETTS